MKDLLDDVQRQAVERFCIMRAAAVAEISDPRLRLKAMIESGLPTDCSDPLCRLLYELGAYSRSDASYAARHIALFERQVSIYLGILEAGAATGVFKLRASSDTVARSLVVLEDGLWPAPDQHGAGGRPPDRARPSHQLCRDGDRLPDRLTFTFNDGARKKS